MNITTRPFLVKRILTVKRVIILKVILFIQENNSVYSSLIPTSYVTRGQNNMIRKKNVLEF